MTTHEVFTLKEMIKEIRDENRQALVNQTSIISELRATNEHLGKLNGKVANHEERIHALKSEHTRVKGFAGGIVFLGGLLWTAVNFVIDK